MLSSRIRVLTLPLASARWRALLQALVAVAGAGLIALSARVAVPVPFSPVPITAQTLAVLTLAGLLGRRSAASVALYLAGGALGLPVLATSARLTGPTGGYLVGFFAAAYLAGWLCERSAGRPLALALALLLGQALIYACGLAWLARFLPGERLLAAGLYPFLVGDAYKLAISLLVVAPARRYLSPVGNHQP